MRLLEISIPLLLSIYLLWRAPRPQWVNLLPIIALGITLIHLIIEGYRWQMIPLYALIAILVAISLRSTSDWRPLASYLTLGLVAVSTALPALLPVPRIPAPSGPFPVGTSIHELVDDSRREIYSGEDEARRFMIQVWYPSEAGTSSEQARWMDNAEIYAPVISKEIDMPSFFLNHLALVDIPAYKNATVAKTEQGFPVVLFSHGWTGFNAQNTSQALELASHGYIVVGVQHTYGASITVFPNGDIAPNNPNALLSSEAPIDEYEATAHILVEQWAGDLSYTVEYLQSLGTFAGVLDLERLGAYGHSTGGGAAIQFCATDARCKAVLGMDPFMRPVSYEVIDSGVSQPSFYMFSQRWADDVESRNNELFNRFYPHVTDSLGVIAIDGTAHYDFADLPLLSPLAPQLGLKGPINGKLVNRIVNDYLLAFFEQTLNGTASSLFTEPSPYAEVKTVK